MKKLLLLIAVFVFTKAFSQSHKAEVKPDTLKGSPLTEQMLDTMRSNWLHHNLQISTSASPMPGKWTLFTESKHPAVSATTELVLEIFTDKGKRISTQSIMANGRYEFAIPLNYKGSYMVYKVIWGRVSRTGKIDQ